MAALRLSFSEINTLILKEDIMRREQTKFRHQLDQIETLYSSKREVKFPMRGYKKGMWDKKNFRKAEKRMMKVENDLSQTQKERYNLKNLGRGQFSPLWLPTQVPSPPVSFTSRKPEEPVSISHQGDPKKIISQGAQKPPLVAPRGTPLVRITAHTGSEGISHKVLKSPQPKSNTLKQTAERNLDAIKSPHADRSKKQSPVKAKAQSPANSPMSKPRATIALNKTETQGKELNTNKQNFSQSLPISKPGANLNHLKKQYFNETQIRGLPEKDGAKVAGEKKFNFSQDHIVIITKEKKLKIGSKETPSLKTIFPRTLGKIQSKHVLENRREVSVTSLALQRTAVLQTVRTLAGGQKPTKINLTVQSQPMGYNQNLVKTYLPEDQGMHHVLRIDMTLSPRDPKAPGQFGHPVFVPPEKKKVAERRWKEGNFNVYLSDLIPIDRAIGDTRPSGCAEQLVHNTLPTTSVIMCFVDEVWSTLLRSVHSVLNRSPPHLIKEILLVDDFSTKDYLKDKLDKYMSQFPKVRILHLKERHGLIRARLAGAQEATGDVLTFLDSHVECNVGWLEPLLERVYLSRKKVACPVIEVINDKDMSYMTVNNFQRGIFVWPMNFAWRTIPPDVVAKNNIKETDIIRCPIMAGGLFSIDKSYFYELGTYDPGLDVWGGENMELSFKVWMCGGEVEIVPCSRVGHIFRDDNPYSFPKDPVKTVERNLMRVAEVWLDEYKELFYGHRDHLLDQVPDAGNLTQQRELRQKLKCKSFKWYLENVFPDLKAPLMRASGVLVNEALGKCIAIENSTAVLESCDGSSQLQQFNYTWLKLIKHGEWCLAPIPDKGSLRLHPCDNRNKGLKWLHKSTSFSLPGLVNHIVFEHNHQLLCLEGNFPQKSMKIVTCDPMKLNQKWKFEKYYDD